MILILEIIQYKNKKFNLTRIKFVVVRGIVRASLVLIERTN
jgi:hypothetical protein